jgi:rhodanese-related sulfurtransferase
MPSRIARDDILRLLHAGGQLVGVLPADEYQTEHLPGAVNIPLKALDAARTVHLDKTQPVIVYCCDAL